MTWMVCDDGPWHWDIFWADLWSRHICNLCKLSGNFNIDQQPPPHPSPNAISSTIANSNSIKHQQLHKLFKFNLRGSVKSVWFRQQFILFLSIPRHIKIILKQHSRHRHSNANRFHQSMQHPPVGKIKAKFSFKLSLILHSSLFFPARPRKVSLISDTFSIKSQLNAERIKWEFLSLHSSSLERREIWESKRNIWI